MNENKETPSTITEAVNILLSDLSIEDKHRIKNSNEDGSIALTKIDTPLLS